MVPQPPALIALLVGLLLVPGPLLLGIALLQRRRLERYTRLQAESLRQRPCRLDGQVGSLLDLAVMGNLRRPKIRVSLRLLDPADHWRSERAVERLLRAPAGVAGLRSEHGWRRYLREEGAISLLPEEGLETSAVRAAWVCHGLARWTDHALLQVRELQNRVATTLIRAQAGEPDLASWVGLLDEAHAGFADQEHWLRRELEQDLAKLKALRAFLATQREPSQPPDFDPLPLLRRDALKTRQRHHEARLLRQAAFRELSRQQVIGGSR